MAKPIDQTLMRFAILRVSNDALVKPERPMRKYIPGDGENISHIVTEIRSVYSRAIIEMREEAKDGSPNFKRIRDSILERECIKHGWTLETRNLYASVISRYITLDRRTNPDEPIVSLEELRAFEQMFLRPKIV